MKVQSKTIVVTGAGNGIGRALTLLLLNMGARVAAIDLSKIALEETIEQAAAKRIHLSTHAADITQREGVEALPEQVMAHHGSIDGIINNAGIIQPFVRVNDLTFEAAERVMNVNFYGTLNMVKCFLPHLLQRQEAHIVNISSMGGFLPVPGQSVYGASKAAVKLLTEALYAELVATNVRVTIVFPGAVETDISKNSGVELKTDAARSSNIKMLTAQKAAEIIVKGMEQNKFRVLAGSDATLMDILYRISPRMATNFITRMMKDLL